MSSYKGEKIGTIICQGYTPLPHQKAVHDLLTSPTDHLKVIVKSRRQCGKSAIIEQELLRWGINKPRSTSICLSPTLSQGKKIYDELLEAIRSSGIVARCDGTRLTIKLRNGSWIKFKSAEQGENLRGETVTGILCIDEAAYIPDDVYYTVLPWCNVFGPPILMCSTPRFKQGFFWDCWLAALEGQKKHICVDFNDYDTSLLLSQDILEEYRKNLPSQQFKTEYLGQFIESDGMVFTGMGDCISNAKIDDAKDIYVGIDWGGGKEGDYTSLSAIDGNMQQVAYFSFNRQNTTQQIATLSQWLIRYRQKIKGIMAEVNGLGEPLTELLKDSIAQYGLRVTNWTTTNSSKCDMVAQLQVALEQKQIGLIQDEKQLRELANYECAYNPKSRTTTYNAPLGQHDDAVMSLMISMQCYKKHHITGGRYLLG